LLTAYENDLQEYYSAMHNKNLKSDIRAVIFDMGRVLVNIDSTLLVKKLFKGLEAGNLQELASKTMRDPAMVAFNTGQIEVEDFHRRMCKTYRLDLDIEEFKALWCEIFYTMEGMKELVGNLDNRLAISLLSDTDPIHWGYIKTTWPWIDDIKNPTLSYEVGIMKPDAAIYLTAAKNVATDPRHCLFIDDLEVNVEGARAVGMQGIRFESPAELAKELDLVGH
jgi:FMN phosphatase YigB (HAD superfamily)